MNRTVRPKNSTVGATTPAERIALALAAAAPEPDPIKETTVAEPTNDQITALQAAIDAAVNKAIEAKDAAIADLTARLAANDEDNALKAKDAELAAKDAEIDALTTRAGAAEAEVTRLTQEATDFGTALTEAAEAAEAAEALALVKAERAKVLTEDLKWDPARVEARADHYASLNDDNWTAALADLRAQANLHTGDAPPPPDPPIAGAQVIGGSPATASAMGPNGNVAPDARTTNVLTNRHRLASLPA